MDSDDEQLEQLARDYEHRVGFFARKVARSYVLGERWQDELESAGYWGLAKALKNRRTQITNEIRALLFREAQLLGRTAAG